jgi:hypothetical protein
MRDPRLWERISNCHPDDLDAALPFSKRLARDNGWSHGFALRVILEYQRFAYLCRLGTGMATPSDEVDQAWHLHMIYTKHYWGPFRQALGDALHHMPTTGGPDQADLFKAAYERTLDLYRHEFGEPPADIWPPADIRFGRAPHFKRVNTRDVWILPRPGLPVFLRQVLKTTARIPASIHAVFAVLGIPIAGAGVALAHGSPHGDTLLEKLRNMVWHWATEHTEAFLIALFALIVIGIALVKKSTGNSGSGSGCGGSGCGSDGGSGCSGCGGD